MLEYKPLFKKRTRAPTLNSLAGRNADRTQLSGGNRSRLANSNSFPCFSKNGTKKMYNDFRSYDNQIQTAIKVLKTLDSELDKV